MKMDYRLMFAVVFLNFTISAVLSASTTPNYDNNTSITTDSSTIIPINNETSTLPPNDNGTTVTLPPNDNGTTVTLPPNDNGTTVTLPVDNSTIPMTIEPSNNFTGSTITPGEMTSSKIISIHTTVPLPKTTAAAPSSGFDGGSFAGGIVLGAFLILTMFGVLWYCRRRTGYSNLSS
ncbi:integumentary mucin A.1-like isoform X2 [Argopecten irradians]|uniref:integumentary mucin A.1-like isoform X2 n=1 Tax=Argopecten irradians TaxID=31199 RepID=UPI0037162480